MNHDKAEAALRLIEQHRRSIIDPDINPKPERAHALIFDNRVALSVADTASALGLSPRTIERMIHRGDLRARRTGRRVLIPKTELEAWLNRQE